MKTVLTIAGSDSSGGAGIQADLKTMIANGVYGMSAITAMTAQNTTGVRAIQEAAPDFLGQQIDAVFEDIYPDAVKIGMVSSAELIKIIAERLKYYKAKNVVIDPVMVSTSGSSLIKRDALTALKKQLLPLATIVTPNVPEAQILAKTGINSRQSFERAVRSMGESFGCAVLLKGGHAVLDASDVLYDNGEIQWFFGKRIDNPNTHGTGCTLSSAIASNLAKGFTIPEAVKLAKDYISGALADMMDLGKGSGPINHGFSLTSPFINN